MLTQVLLFKLFSCFQTITTVYKGEARPHLCDTLDIVGDGDDVASGMVSVLMIVGVAICFGGSICSRQNIFISNIDVNKVWEPWHTIDPALFRVGDAATGLVNEPLLLPSVSNWGGGYNIRIKTPGINQVDESNHYMIDVRIPRLSINFALVGTPTWPLAKPGWSQP